MTKRLRNRISEHLFSIVKDKVYVYTTGGNESEYKISRIRYGKCKEGCMRYIVTIQIVKFRRKVWIRNSNGERTYRWEERNKPQTYLRSTNTFIRGNARLNLSFYGRLFGMESWEIVPERVMWLS